VTRLADLLADLPAELLGRLPSDRVMQLPAPPRQPGTMGRPRKHGGELALADLATWPAPQVSTTTVTSRYGIAVAAAWNRVHPRLAHRSAWLDHDGPLPVIEGTLIRLQVDHLPGRHERCKCSTVSHWATDTNNPGLSQTGGVCPLHHGARHRSSVRALDVRPIINRKEEPG
jgi:hypothetical protein